MSLTCSYLARSSQTNNVELARANQDSHILLMIEAAPEEPVAGSSTYQVKATDCLNCRAKKVACERPG